ncbi:N-formylglutamate amidohydrolase [Roseibium sp. TrichSKD4]|nr:N-formylglutamate amidohydrolase [Roseibium sp. TrichSKD4]
MEARAKPHMETPAVEVVNRSGEGHILLVCDHASNRFPAPFDTTLGIFDKDAEAHIAWDPGAVGVSLQLSRLLDAPLVYSTVSRLVIDCNRDPSAHDLIPAVSEVTEIPGNRNLSEDEKQARLNLAHRPFHDAISDVIEERRKSGRPTAVISVHSYTPVYKGEERPWEIGLIAAQDRRLIDPALTLLRAQTEFQVGDNEPYSPEDGVYYTLTRHGEALGLPSLMIEIRNNEVATAEAEKRWAETLAPVLQEVVGQVNGAAHA